MLIDTGAGAVSIDSVDAPRFITISTNPFVQTAVHDHQHAGGAMTILLALAARGCTAQYATDTSWPVETRPWYTIRDGMHRLKREAMKTALMLGQADHYLTDPITAYHRNLIVRTAPPAYKHIMMTLLLAETGQPVEQILEKMVGS